jgi:glycosyltransferase involved in cell wall biosynthesis
MRVMRVIAKLEPGGAQLGAFRLSAALSGHGIHSRLVAGDATAEGLALARDHGFEVECFASGGAGPDLQWTPSEAFASWLEPRIAGADLVHAHMFGGWWAAARALPDGVPLAASEHNALSWPGPAREDAARLALERVDRFYAHGPTARAQIAALGYPPQRLAIGRGTIPAERSGPLPGLRSPRVVFAGRLAPDKGPDLLVEALALLARPPAAYLLGAGGMRDALERRARELGVADAVCLPGWQADPGGWIAGAGVFAAPSRQDAWSQSVVLAMALGTPVVAAAVEGLPDVLAHGRGVLVAPEDPEALAAAIADVLAGRRRPDRAAARVYAEQFTPERVALDYAADYRALTAPLSAAAGPAPGARPWSA